MQKTHRRVGILLATVAASALTLVSATPASAATWTLEGEGQRICVHPDKGHPRTYFLVPVSGSSSAIITAELRNLPPGSTFSEGKIHPGEWEDRDEFIGMVGVSIAPAPAGEYVVELWASDGTEIQTDPVLIDFRVDCLG